MIKKLQPIIGRNGRKVPIGTFLWHPEEVIIWFFLSGEIAPATKAAILKIVAEMLRKISKDQPASIKQVIDAFEKDGEVGQEIISLLQEMHEESLAKIEGKEEEYWKGFNMPAPSGPGFGPGLDLSPSEKILSVFARIAKTLGKDGNGALAATFEALEALTSSHGLVIDGALASALAKNCLIDIAKIIREADRAVS